MRLMPVTACLPGMRLGKKIFSEDGVVLLAEGVELTQGLLNRLSSMGIHYIYIQDPKTEGIEIPELISEETQRRALKTVKNVFREMADSSRRGIYPYVGKAVRETMSTILDDLYSNRDAMIMLLNLQSVDHYLYLHSLNVCVYTSLLGIANGYSRDELMTLGLGSLLHDVGKSRIPLDVLLKPGALSKQEFEEMKRHTERGFQLLKDEPNLPLIVAHCAFQHHERLDGSGYPRGIRGSEIHEYAKWIGIVDSYDAMTSHRIYRNAMLPHQAVELLYAGSETLYDTEMLRLFRDKVAIYPVGMTVELSSGQSGVIVDVNTLTLHRPIVRILTDEAGVELKTPYDMDLSKHLSVMISRVVTSGPALTEA